MDRKVLIGGGAAVGAVVLFGGILTQAAPARKKAASLGAAEAAAAIAQLKKDEATVKSGRLSLLTTQRVGDVPDGATDAIARAALGKAPLAGQHRESLIFSGPDWRRDVSAMDAQGEVGAHYLFGVRNKVSHIVQETGHAEKATRSAGIGAPVEVQGPDLLLTSHGTDLVERREVDELQARGHAGRPDRRQR